MAASPNTVHERHRLASAERKSAIVETAIRLFAEKGFRGTTTREIAAACGVSEPVLYQHFATKRDLFNAIIDAQSLAGMEPFKKRIEPFLSQNDDRGFLTELAKFSLEWYAEYPGSMRLMLFSALEGSELTEMFVERQLKVFFEQFSAYLSRRMDEGGLRRMNPELAGRAFVGMIAKYVMDRQIFHIEDGATDDEVIDTMVGIFLRGIEA